jgi:hypothetical protein
MMRSGPGALSAGGGARPGDAGGNLLSRLIGGRAVRYNRFLDKIGAAPFVAKIPKDFGSDEENVILGLGTTAVVAIGATATLAINVPRDCILRSLLVSDLAGGNNFVVSAITVEGKSYLLGSSAPGSLFNANNIQAQPSFDVPVAGGTPVSVTIQNTSGAAQTYGVAFTID